MSAPQGNSACGNFELEVCVDRVEDALAAAQAGATRIEINSALACSGLTPTVAACRWLAQHCPVPVWAMLRPHDAGFAYTRVEQELMLRDCELLLETGIEGIVSGALNENGQIDLRFIKRLVELVKDRALVFHRAFDELSNLPAGLEGLIDCGVTRVLTSGGAASATEGASMLAELHHMADGRIEILPGGGINSSNVCRLVEQVGCRQVHGSFRSKDGASNANSTGPDVDEIRNTGKLLKQYGARKAPLKD